MSLHLRFAIATSRARARLCLFVLCIVALIGCVRTPTQLYEVLFTPTAPDPTLSPNTQSILVVEENTLGLVELRRWHFDQEANGDVGSTPPNFFIAGDKVLFSYWAPDKVYYDSILVALSLATGEVIWQTRLYSGPLPTRISWAHLDGERLYLDHAARLDAFNVETGEMLWSIPYPNEDTGYFIRPWEVGDPLLVHTDSRELLTVAPRSGEILSREEDRGTLIQYGPLEFERTMTRLAVIDNRTIQLLWERLEVQPAIAQMRFWPSFVGDDVVFRVGNLCYNIIRANIYTGHIVWETTGRNYLSDFAIAGSRLYALRDDLTLVAFDLATGVVIGVLRFDGPPLTTNCKHSGSGIYWVTASGPHVAVYWGDTREVIVFEERSAP